jgi:hypothetical protein
MLYWSGVAHRVHAIDAWERLADPWFATASTEGGHSGALQHGASDSEPHTQANAGTGAPCAIASDGRHVAEGIGRTAVQSGRVWSRIQIDGGIWLHVRWPRHFRREIGTATHRDVHADRTTCLGGQDFITRSFTTQSFTTQGLTTQGFTTQGFTTQGLTTQGLTTQGLTTQGLTTQGLITQDGLLHIASDLERPMLGEASCPRSTQHARQEHASSDAVGHGEHPAASIGRWEAARVVPCACERCWVRGCAASLRDGVEIEIAGVWS